MRVFKPKLNRLALIGATLIMWSSVVPLAQARPPLPPGWVGPNYYAHGRYWHHRYPVYRHRRRYWRYR